MNIQYRLTWSPLLLVVTLMAASCATSPKTTPAPAKGVESTAEPSATEQPTFTPEPATSPAEDTAVPTWPAERSASDRESAIAAIREFTGLPDLEVTYVELTTHSQNGQLRVERYETAEAVYEVDFQTNRVVDLSVKDPNAIPLGSPLSAEELGQKARQFMLAKNACFRQAEPYLEPIQHEKGGENYFYRWQYPQPGLVMPGDIPIFAQINMKVDGRVYNYTDAGICRVNFVNLVPYTSPTPAPTATSTPSPVIDACQIDDPALRDKVAGWQRYTNLAYSFSFCFPPEWSLEEIYDPYIEISGGHSLQIKLKSTLPSVMMIGCKKAWEPVLITPTGVGHGEFFQRGTVIFLGQEIERNVLVAEGKDTAVFYGAGEITRGKLAFSLILDTFYEAELIESVQAMADQLIASFKEMK